MSGNSKDDAPARLDTIRKWTRDAFIVGGIVIVVIYPSIIGRVFKEAQVVLLYDEASKTWTVKAIEENRNLATDIAQLTTKAQALQEQVQRIASGKADANLSDLSQQVENLVTKANAASESAAASLANQQSAPGAPDAAQASDGWMFLGKVSSHNAEAWVGQHYIRVEKPIDLATNKFAVDGNVFLHASGQPPGGIANKGWHVRQRVIGGIKSGEIVQILNTEVDEAIDGGWAMWAQVKRAG